MAKVIAITYRSPYSYQNLLRPTYNGVVTKNKKGQFIIDFKYHQMSYKTMPLHTFKAKMEDFVDKKVSFRLDKSFNAFNIV